MFSTESLALAALILSIFILHRVLSRKKFITALSLIVALSALGLYLYSRPSREAVMTVAERTHMGKQQEIVAEWHAEYQELIIEMDRNWRQYHRILSDFAADNISIEVAYDRFIDLANDAAMTLDKLEAMDPPIELDDTSYDLVTSIIMKTRDYARGQLATIKMTMEEANPETIKAEAQEEQAKLLKEIMAKTSPAGLFTASEIRELRDGVNPKG